MFRHLSSSELCTRIFASLLCFFYFAASFSGRAGADKGAHRQHGSRSLLLLSQKDGKLYNTLLFALVLSLFPSALWQNEGEKRRHAGGRALKEQKARWKLGTGFSLLTTYTVRRTLVQLKSEARREFTATASAHNSCFNDFSVSYQLKLLIRLLLDETFRQLKYFFQGKKFQTFWGFRCLFYTFSLYLAAFMFPIIWNILPVWCEDDYY